MGERHILSTFVLQAVECTVGRGYGVCVGVCVVGAGVCLWGVCVFPWWGVSIGVCVWRTAKQLLGALLGVCFCKYACLTKMNGHGLIC